jgi:two-component sensor histidine kinase/CHASE3 domain sensor protein
VSPLARARVSAAVSLEAVVIVGFGFMLLLLGASVWLSAVDTQKMRDAILWVDRTLEFTGTLKELELDLREAESALRTYIISGDASELEDYRLQAMDEMPSHLRALRRLGKYQPEQIKTLDTLERMLHERVALMEKSRLAYEASGVDPAEQRTIDRAGAKLSRQILAVFSQLATQEKNLLAERIRAREVRARFVMRANIASGALGLICVAIALAVILGDLKKRHQAEAQLRVSLQEKEILLKEIHHRVKNNLQVVSSLLSLQAEKVSDPEARIVFAECRDRIHLMARLHQQLYSNGCFAEVDFGEHLREMTEILARSHNPPGCEVELKVANEPVRIELDLAINLGLIANELILNALKHAFPGRASGVLSVALKKIGEKVEMSISDDGIGLPEGFDPAHCASLGMELVRGLAHQIHGSMAIEGPLGVGTRIEIRFPIGAAD